MDGVDALSREQQVNRRVRSHSHESWLMVKRHHGARQQSRGSFPSAELDAKVAPDGKCATVLLRPSGVPRVAVTEPGCVPDRLEVHCAGGLVGADSREFPSVGLVCAEIRIDVGGDVAPPETSGFRYPSARRGFLSSTDGLPVLSHWKEPCDVSERP